MRTQKKPQRARLTARLTATTQVEVVENSGVRKLSKA